MRAQGLAGGASASRSTVSDMLAGSANVYSNTMECRELSISRRLQLFRIPAKVRGNVPMSALMSASADEPLNDSLRVLRWFFQCHRFPRSW